VPNLIHSTGTPAGIAEILGDVIEATIEKIGTLKNYVVGY
jgi:2-keto-4-pentenoate hydratase/2-oxohepta-3-ene-1,7-dioic acid hydratase in catechol pathway